jgi:myosin heavy subunit
MNPFKQVKGAFGPEQIQRWRSGDHSEVLAVPHAYSVVEKAYQGMSERQVDQSILVSGMSGAGKSETVKICINYLSSIGGGQSQLERKINDAGMVLESFGNAFTVHNANSSRFGKYTKMFFEHGKPMVGAEIKTYLLEKTRVAHPPDDERNFHIFYQALNGMTDSRRADLHLTTPNDYQILKTNLSPTSLLATGGNLDKEDSETYNDLMERLTRLGFTQEDIDNMVQVLAAILHLGNISFGETRQGAVSLAASTEGESDDGEAFVKNIDTLNFAA